MEKHYKSYLSEFANEHYEFYDAIKDKPTHAEFMEWGPWIYNDWQTEFEPTKNIKLG